MLEGALRIYKVSSLSPQGEIHMVQFQRGIVIVASTAAQVDFWARLIQSLGVPPAGFPTDCAILNLEDHVTTRKRNDA